MPRQDLIRVRRDSLADWLTVDPVLALGELGAVLDIDGGTVIGLVVGDGQTHFSALQRILPGAGGTGAVASVDGQTGAVNLSGSYDALGAATSAYNNAILRANHSGVQPIAATSGLQAALDAKIPLSQKGVPLGVATLDSNGKLLLTQTPSSAFTSVDVVASQAEMLALSAAVEGAFAIRTDTDESYVLNQTPPSTLGNWILFTSGGGGAVSSVDGLVGAVDLSGSYEPLGAVAALALLKQNADADLSALAAAGNSAILAATTATYDTAKNNKLTTIEPLADVTDAANVAAAGAVMTTGNQSIGGTKTFTVPLVVATPVAAQEAATKAYVDALAAGDSGITVKLALFGGTPDQKLTAAIAAVRADSFKRAIEGELGEHTFSQTRTFTSGAGGTAEVFDGLKFIAPRGSGGPKSATAGDQPDHNHIYKFDGGNTTASWWNSAGATNPGGGVFHIWFDGIVTGLGSGNEQFWHTGTTSTLYACAFTRMSWYGYQHVFGDSNATGTSGTAARMTRCTLDGDSSIHSSQGVPIHVTGADCKWFFGGDLNIEAAGTSPAGQGRPLIWLDGMEKFDMGHIFLTTKGDWGGLKITGNSSQPTMGCRIWGGQYEGREDGDPTYAKRPVIEVGGTGGSVMLKGVSVGQVTDAGSALGVVQHSGAVNLDIDGIHYKRPTTNDDAGNGCSVAFPLLYQLDGTTGIMTAGGVRCRGTEQARYRFAGGAVQTLALPTNLVAA